MTPEGLKGMLDAVPVLLCRTELMQRGLARKNYLAGYVAKDWYCVCAGVFSFEDAQKGRYVVLNSDCDDLARKLLHECVVMECGRLMDMENITVGDRGSDWLVTNHYWSDKAMRQVAVDKVIDCCGKYGL